MGKSKVNKKRPLPNPAEIPLPKGYDQKQVEDGVRAFFKVLEKSSSKKSLFQDGEFIQVEVVSVRIPKCFNKYYRFFLPHGYLKDTSEVLLFVRNLSKYTKEYEDTVKHFKNLLSEAGVTGVSEVMSINQLMQEYRSYEMKRRLASRYDVVLADSHVNNWLHGLLGKHFHHPKKMPSPIQIHSKNLKVAIDGALTRTMLRVSGKGNQFLAMVGNTNQSEKQICENIEAFVRGLCVKFPGKWGNIRSLHLRSYSCPRIPLYYSFADPNSVQVPKVKLGKRPRWIPLEKDEISTLPDGYQVYVKADGNIRVKGKKANGKLGWLTDAETEQLDIDFNFEDGSGNEEEIASDDEREETSANGDEEKAFSDSDEADVEAAEEAYLKELNMTGSPKGKKRKVKGEEESISPIKKTKKTANGKNNPVTAQWNVEELDETDGVKQNEGEKLKKSAKKSKKADKTLALMEETEEQASDSKVKVKKQKKLVKKVANETSKDVLKDKVKVERVLRKKKKSVVNK